MRVMGVDLGRPGGLVVLCDEGAPKPWPICAVELPYNLSGLDLQRTVHRLAKEHRVDLVATERPGFWGDPRIGMAQREKQGLVRAVCESLQVRLVSYQPQEIKKAVTGHGRAPKEVVTRCVRVLIRLASEDEHVCDAAGIALVAMNRERARQLASGQQRLNLRRSPRRKVKHS